MNLQLTGRVGDQNQSWRLESEVATVGRSSRHAVHIADATVSKDHAEITRHDGKWVIRDLGSRNGTRVNGKDAREAIELKPGDTLEIGHVLLTIGEGVPDSRPRLAETMLTDTARVRADHLIEGRAGSGTMPSRIVRAIAEAGRLLVLPRPLRETCEALLQSVEQALPASRYVILLKESADADPVQIAARTSSGKADAPLVLSSAIIHTVLDACTSVITRDAAQDPRFQSRQSVVMQAIRSAMAVPLFDNEKVLGLLYVDRQTWAEPYTPEDLELLTLLGNMAAVKITNARLLQAEADAERMRIELGAAARLQKGLLPGAPAVPGYSFDAFLETCYEVGGDLYDFFVQPDGKLVFVLGDVSGKGMGAALLTFSFLSSARVLYEFGGDLGTLAARLGDLVYRNTDSIHYVTAFLGRLDPASGELEYVNAGHPPAVAVAGNGDVHLLEGTGIPFGMMEGMPYRVGRAELASGGTLAVFSDGIPEAQCGEEFFDFERLHALLREHHAAPLPELRTAVVEAVRTFAGDTPRSDDITLLLLRREA